MASTPERQPDPRRSNGRRMVPVEVEALLRILEALETALFEHGVEQINVVDEDIGAKFDDVRLAAKHLAILPDGGEPLVLDAIGEDRAPQAEQAVDGPRGPLHVAAGSQIGAGIEAVHQRAVGEVEALAANLFDQGQGRGELRDEAAKHAGQDRVLDDDAGQRVATLDEAPEIGEQRVPIDVEREARIEQCLRDCAIVPFGQHQRLHLADVRRSQHVEEPPDFAGRLAVVIGVDDRRDVETRSIQQRGDQRRCAATTI